MNTDLLLWVVFVFMAGNAILDIILGLMGGAITRSKYYGGSDIIRGIIWGSLMLWVYLT